MSDEIKPLEIEYQQAPTSEFGSELPQDFSDQEDEKSDTSEHPFTIDELARVVRPQGQRQQAGQTYGQAFYKGATQTLSASSTIEPIATIIPLVSSGGLVPLTSSPQIDDGIDGQIVILKGTDDTNRPELQDGSGLKLSASCALSQYDTLTLYYDADDDVWIEIARSNN